MWIAKFIIKHDCILGNRCEKFKVTLQSVNFSTFKEKGKIITSSMHYISGESTSIDKFFNDLNKDTGIIKLDRKENTFFLLEKSKEKAVQFHTPKIIFIKPVLMNQKGYETWEIGSWEKEEISRFIKKVEKHIKDFKLIKFTHINIDNIFFPKLMPDLTDKQRQAIELAIQNNYYKSPRKIGLRKLAKIMGVSLSTYQQHLRTAEEKLIPNLLSYSL